MISANPSSSSAYLLSRRVTDLAQPVSFSKSPPSSSPQSPPNLQQSDSIPRKVTLASESGSAREAGARNAEAEQEALERDQRIIAELAARDREVKAHEQAHAAVGGRYAGAPSYTYERGPDGVSYAVAGEVPIDIGREASPEATLQKAQIVRRAALAPASPSSQDYRVAAKASRMEMQARADINAARTEAAKASEESEIDSAAETNDAENGQVGSPQTGRDALSPSEPAQSNTIFSRANERLELAIANTAINANQPGNLFNQIA